jgi:hypothetical protein
VAVARRGPVTVIHSRAFVVAGGGTNPGRETFLRRKSRRRGTDFGNDLGRGINPTLLY